MNNPRTSVFRNCCAALLLSGLPIGAAQATTANDDVIVMRRVLTAGTLLTNHWRVGDWMVEPACSDDVPERRDVTCVAADGNPVPDTSCRGPKPASAARAEDRRGCLYRWELGAFGDWAEACADRTHRTRDVVCTRYGGGSAEVPAPDQAACGTPAPDTFEEAANYAGCTYAWQTVPGECVGDGQRTTWILVVSPPRDRPRQ